MSEEEKYIPKSAIRPDTKEDFEPKNIELDTFKNIVSNMSEEDIKIYNASLEILNESVSQILNKLHEQYSDPDSAMTFIKGLNESLRGNNVK
jgi:hypothetical protein